MLTAMQDESTLIVENMKAEKEIEDGRLPEAAAILVSIVESDPENWRAYNNLGIIAWKQEDWADAFTLFRTSCELYAGDADAISNLFDAALKLRKLDEVEYMLREAVVAQPYNEEVKEIVEAIDEDGENIYYCERSLEEGFFHPDLAEADELVKEHRLNEALIKYIDFIEGNQPAAEAYNGIGVISYYQGRYDDAYKMLLESIKINPINKDTILNFFDAARMCGKVDKAYDVFKTCRENYPKLAQLDAQIEGLIR